LGALKIFLRGGGRLYQRWVFGFDKRKYCFMNDVEKQVYFWKNFWLYQGIFWALSLFFISDVKVFSKAEHIQQDFYEQEEGATALSQARFDFSQDHSKLKAKDPKISSKDNALGNLAFDSFDQAVADSRKTRALSGLVPKPSRRKNKMKVQSQRKKDSLEAIHGMWWEKGTKDMLYDLEEKQDSTQETLEEKLVFPGGFSRSELKGNPLSVESKDTPVPQQTSFALLLKIKEKLWRIFLSLKALVKQSDELIQNIKNRHFPHNFEEDIGKNNKRDFLVDHNLGVEKEEHSPSLEKPKDKAS
jgi:hypothetical protein